MDQISGRRDYIQRRVGEVIMFEVQIDKEFIVYQEGTSDGTQIKYKKDGYWYKLDSQGHEGLCEYLCSKLLEYSDLDPDEYVPYEQGIINSINGCRSRSFLREEDEELVTVYRLYYNEFGRDLAKVLSNFDSMEERIDYTVRFVLNSTGMDIFDYFRKIFTLDMIVLNEDRHVNNLALISTSNGFKPAPIFDNGKSLLTANVSVKQNLDISENVKRVIARPFSGLHKMMFDHFGKGFSIDYGKAIKWLTSEPESMERDVLLYQLENYRDIIAEDQ